MQHAEVAAQTSAALKATGGVANVSAKQIEALAGSLMHKTGVDDEAIQHSENLLLAFRNVRNEAGAGNDVFNRATLAIQDMAAATGKSADALTAKLGKTLADPAKGLTKLTALGVSFTEGQKAQIKALEASGHTLEAQKVILAGVNASYGGAAEAAGKTLPGQLNILRETFNNLAGDLVAKLMPSFQALTSWVSEHGPQIETVLGGAFAVIGASVKEAARVMEGFVKLVQANQTLFEVVGAAVAGLVISFEAYRTAVAAATIAQGAFNVVAAMNPYVLIAAGVVAAVAALTVLELKFHIAEKAAHALADAFRATKDWVSANWPEIATIISGPFAPLVALATGAFGVRSALEGALRAVKTFTGGIVEDIAGFFEKLPGRLLGFATAAGHAITAGFQAGLAAFGAAIAALIKGPLNAVLSAWNNLAIPGFDLHVNMPSPIPDISFGWGGVSLPDIPMLAQGGRIAETGIAVVHKGETVVPPGRGGDINVTINAPNYVGSKDEFMRVAVAELARYAKRNGGLGFA